MARTARRGGGKSKQFHYAPARARAKTLHSDFSIIARVLVYNRRNKDNRKWKLWARTRRATAKHNRNIERMHIHAEWTHRNRHSTGTSWRCNIFIINFTLPEIICSKPTDRPTDRPHHSVAMIKCLVIENIYLNCIIFNCIVTHAHTFLP